MIFLLQVSPQIIEPPIGQSVTEGYPVNLSCVASGVPTPTLVWTFNDGNLPFGINQTGHEGESFLASPSVTKGMNGTYKCKAKNKANTISSSATLLVYGKFSYYDIDHDDDDNEDDDDDDDFDDDDDDSDDDDDDDDDDDNDDDDDDDDFDDDDDDDGNDNDGHNLSNLIKLLWCFRM